MTVLSSRLSTSDLTQRILDMAKSGVYRESIFDAFRPVATKRQIRSAIASAKQFGLHSVPTLRDAELGTYYQVDLTRYQSLQTALNANVPLELTADLAKQMLVATQTIRWMLAISGGLAIGLFGVGGICVLMMRSQMAAMTWIAALCAAAIWGIQRRCAVPFLGHSGEDH